MTTISNQITGIDAIAAAVKHGMEVAEQSPANKADELFTKAYNKAEHIAFQDNWANGTGYFDHAVRGENAPVVAAGEMLCSRDQHGRRILIIGTHIGNVMIFDRYSNDRGIFTFNADIRLLRAFGICHTALTEEAMLGLVGDDRLNYNIGQRCAMLQVA